MQSRTKTLVLLSVFILVFIGGYFLYTTVYGPLISDRTTEAVTRPDLNLSFTFTGGDDGYAFVEPPLGDEMKAKGIESVFILMDADEYASFRTSSEGGEAPKSISLFVVKEEQTPTTTEVGTSSPRIDRKTKLRIWAETNASLTAYTLAQGTVEDVEVDGATAIRYTADGLYPQTIYVVYFKDRYYLFTGQYDGEGDTRKADFEALIQSVLFG